MRTSSLIVVIAIAAALVFVAASTFAAIITEAQAVKGEARRHISSEGERHMSGQGARAAGVCTACT